MNIISIRLQAIAEFTKEINVPSIENYSFKYDKFGDGEYIVTREEVAISIQSLLNGEFTQEMQNELNNIKI